MITAVQTNISSTDTLTAAMSPLRIIMAAGGTGGHVYPAIAIADSLKKKMAEAEILFVGTRDRMEWKTVPKYGYQIKSIWISGFHRTFTFKNLLFPLKVLVSLVQSMIIIRSFKPDLVISCGGFAAGPIGWIASQLRIPLFIQEQNSYPGVTNRLLSKHAVRIFTAFDDASSYLPSEKIVLTGNPVRSEMNESDRETSFKIFGFNSQLKTVLILGGSGGARAINNIMAREIENLHNKGNLQIIWQCGNHYIEALRNKIDINKYPNLRLVAFIDDMPAAYEVADLVITRAGAGTCSELMNLGQPAILIPSPNVAGNHQFKNAKSLKESGAAELLDESDLNDRFTEKIFDLLHDPKRLEQMKTSMLSLSRPNASDQIVKEILKRFNRDK